ncbi:hypothetical protein [Flavobacterium sp.]|uniref:hypothetical protein n=1 Tax=Flavobacterium sp. TaxID=239 RepID=UPI0035291E35
MKFTFYITVLFFISFFGFSQSVATPKLLAIESNFSVESVKVYQNNANLKIEDFYNYLSLYSQENTSEELKIEVKKNIFRLVENETILLSNFTIATDETILLLNFLAAINNKNYTFEVDAIQNTPSTEFNFWITNYQLKITQNKKVKIVNCSQKVFFKPVQKTFGSKQKEVWTVFLSTINVI